MKNADRKSMLAIMFLATASCAVQPTLAQSDLEKQKSYLAESIEKNQSNNRVCQEMCELAKRYYESGQKAKAEKTYQEAIKRVKAVQGEQWTANLMIGWAEFIYEHSSTPIKEGIPNSPRKLSELADKKPIENEIMEALPYIDKFDSIGSKFSLCQQARVLCLKLGFVEGERTFNSKIMSIVDSVEKNRNATTLDIHFTSEVLNQLATVQFYVNPPYDRRQKKVIIENRSGNRGDLTEENFETAEKLRIRAVALLDRLPKESYQRIVGHRELSLFYSACEKPEEAEKQKKILSELMGTTEEAKLFPKYLGCSGYDEDQLKGYSIDCGRG